MKKYLTILSATLILSTGLIGAAFAVESLVKKTLDGRCLTSDNPEYQDTNVYIAQPSMEACIKSGGKRED